LTEILLLFIFIQGVLTYEVKRAKRSGGWVYHDGKWKYESRVEKDLSGSGFGSGDGTENPFNSRDEILKQNEPRRLVE
ncbi:hypothetical protein MZO44_16950, partial [Lactiplantibacillus sp. E932]|uniref:hypothetical protein n=1 Tax=Lactiplantibacillus plantarum TaxID=1590 RepID=UPI0020778EE4